MTNSYSAYPVASVTTIQIFSPITASPSGDWSFQDMALCTLNPFSALFSFLFLSIFWFSFSKDTQQQSLYSYGQVCIRKQLKKKNYNVAHSNFTEAKNLTRCDLHFRDASAKKKKQNTT